MSNVEGKMRNVQHRTFNIELPTEEYESEDRLRLPGPTDVVHRSMFSGMSNIRILGEEGRGPMGIFIPTSTFDVECSMFDVQDQRSVASLPLLEERVGVRWGTREDYQRSQRSTYTKTVKR